MRDNLKNPTPDIMSFVLYGSSVLALFGVGYGVLLASFSSPFRSYIALAVCVFSLFYVSHLLIKEKNTGLKFEVLLFFLMILSLFSLGFVSQTYHIKYATLFFWPLMTFVPAFLSRYSINLHVWICAFVVSLIWFFPEVFSPVFGLFWHFWPWLFCFVFFILKNKKVQAALPALSNKAKAFGFWSALSYFFFQTGISLILFNPADADKPFFYLYKDILDSGLLLLFLSLLCQIFLLGLLLIAVAFSEYKRPVKNLIFLIIVLCVCLYIISWFLFNILTLGVFLSVCITVLTIFLFSLLKNKALFFSSIVFFILQIFSWGARSSVVVFPFKALFGNVKLTTGQDDQVWLRFLIFGAIAFIPAFFVLRREAFFRNLNIASVFIEKAMQRLNVMEKIKETNKKAQRSLRAKPVVRFPIGFVKIRAFKGLSIFLFAPVFCLVFLVGVKEYRLRVSPHVALPVRLARLPDFDILSGHYLTYKAERIAIPDAANWKEIHEKACRFFKKKKWCDLDDILSEMNLYKKHRYYLPLKKIQEIKSTRSFVDDKYLDATLVLSVINKSSFLAKDILIDGKSIEDI